MTSSHRDHVQVFEKTQFLLQTRVWHSQGFKIRSWTPPRVFD